MIRKSVSGFAQISLRNLRTVDCRYGDIGYIRCLKEDQAPTFLKRGEFYRLGDATKQNAPWHLP